ncbi:lytic transglycosylase [Flexivirga sp.]|uniref:lytic transglycosylase n=1 Tax=Flexivirga sp. TaxID=1962927 RepID=UPI003F816D2E
MPPLTTGAPPAAVHAIHATADSHHRKASQHAKPAKSKSPRLHPRRSTSVAKKAVRAGSAYLVRPGDNLTTIALRHRVSLTALIKANGISNPDRVLSGSVLRIPHRVAATRTSHKPTSHKSTSHKTTSHKTTSRKTTPKKSHRATQHRTVSRAAERAARRAAATRAALAKRSIPSRTQTKALIERTARRYGVNPHLALGISWQESGWNQRVVSPANAVGVMQVLPQSGEWASSMVGHELDLLDAHDNITAGVVILRYLTGNAKDLDQAIGGYYQGLAGVQQHGPYPETKHYVRNVRALMDRL